MGLGGLEPPTSPLSGVRSNQLSYNPTKYKNEKEKHTSIDLEHFMLLKGGDPAAGSPTATLLRLHPNHQPYLRNLPPIRVSPAASGKTDFRGVTGGVYKARERIHRDILIHDY